MVLTAIEHLRNVSVKYQTANSAKPPITQGKLGSRRARSFGPAGEPDMAGDIANVAGPGAAARGLRRGDSNAAPTLLADTKVLSDGVGECSS